MLAEKINSSNLAAKIIYTQDNLCGLYQGKYGKAILLYLLTKSSSDQQFSEAASEMLNSASDSIANQEQLDFANGLAGIGWAVEWIAQNGFMEINTNEILEDIDDALYKSVVFTRDKNISLANGTLGKLLFFFNRNKSRNPNTHRLKNIFHEECLVLLSDDINEKLLGDAGILKKEKLSEADLLNLGHIIYFLSDFLWTRINEPTVEETLYESIKFIDNYIEKSINGNTCNQSILFLSCCYYLTGRNHKHNYWQVRAIQFIRKFKFDIEMLTEAYRQDNLMFTNKILSSLILKGEINVMPNFLNDDATTLSNSNGKFLLYSLIKNEEPIDLYIPLLLMI